ncbi:MAG: 30S ribosomal protein S21 [Pseudomonadota bacterium]
MLEVKVKANDIKKAIAALGRKIRDDGSFSQLQARAKYVKPGDKKRAKLQKAEARRQKKGRKGR